MQPRCLLLALASVFVASVATAQVCGDANGSGGITVADGVLILRAAASLPTSCTPAICDVDGSGGIGVTDGVTVLRSAAALPVTLNCGGAPQVETRALGTNALAAGVPGPVMEVDARGATSVTLSATTTDDGPSFVLNTLQLPAGQVPLTLFGQPPAVRTDIGAGQITLTIPNTPSIPFADGIYRFNVLTDVPTTAAYHAIINRRQNLTSGQFHLRIFIVDPASDTVPDPADPALVAIRDAINRKLADAGIRLGNVTFGTVPTDIEQDTSVIDSDLDLNFNGRPDQTEILFASTPRDTTLRTVDLFIVREFMGSSIIGFSGGIPGPVMAPPTRSSGVVVAAFNGLNGNPFDAEQLAHIAVHEFGHYMGLFHTTEDPDAIDAIDPIADTPSCAATVFQTNVAACPDVTNLMFPLLFDAALQDQLTPGQGFVLQRNPVITD